MNRIIFDILYDKQENGSVLYINYPIKYVASLVEVN